MAALPFDLAVQVFDEPELDAHRCEIVAAHGRAAARRRSSTRCRPTSRPTSSASCRRRSAPRLLEARSTSRRASALELLLQYPPDTRRRHHDDGVRRRCRRRATVEQALDHVARGRPRRRRRSTRSTASIRTTHTLVHVVSLRDLMLADRSALVSATSATAASRCPCTPTTDREEVARIISKYNLLAVPVVDDARPRARHRDGGRRDRRDRPRADGGRAEVRRYGGARRAVHARSASAR